MIVDAHEVASMSSQVGWLRHGYEHRAYKKQKRAPELAPERAQRARERLRAQLRAPAGGTVFHEVRTPAGCTGFASAAPRLARRRSLRSRLPACGRLNSRNRLRREPSNNL